MSDRQRYTAHTRGLLTLGLPLIGGHLAQLGLHVTDTILLGRYGVDELAAAVLATSYFFVLFIFGSGFAIAVMGMVAASLGRGDEAQVRRDTRMGLWLSILFGAAVLPLFVWSKPVLLALGQRQELAGLAQDFLRLSGPGIVPALLVMVLKSYLAALERTQVVLWITLTGVAVNAALGWALIFGNWGAPEMGLRGSALATLAVQVLSFVLLTLYAAWLPQTRRFHLFRNFWRPDWPALALVFRIGLPIGVTGVAESGLFIAAALMMGWIGTVELAAHGIAMEAAALAFMVHLGLSNAATVRVGRAHGEGDQTGMREVAAVSVALSMLVAALVIGLFLTIPREIIGLFLDRAKPDAEAILAFGTALLAVAALFQLFDAMQVMALGFLRGVQDTRVPMWLAAFSYWGIGIPASYLLAFPLGFGGVGLWLGLVIGLVAASGSLMWRFWSGPAARSRAAP
ncbi:MAG: MATE family efflux transporter [Pseudomonadota bacterium]